MVFLEKYFPGIEENLDVAVIATPKTMERYTGSPRGMVYGHSQIPGQAGFDRGVRTPEGVSIIGAFANPGGGYEGVIRGAWYFFLKQTKKEVRIVLGIFEKISKMLLK